MINKREILREHYLGLAREIVSKVVMLALAVGTLILPATSFAAGQITTRSTTLGSSLLSVSTTYTYAFKPATTGTIKAIKFETCTSPLQTTACSTVTGASMSTSSTFNTAAPTVAPFTTNWVTATGSAAPSANAYWIHYATGNSVTAGTSYTIQLTNIVNPSTTNLQYYTRITTYSDDAAGAPATTVVDYGAMAVATANQVTVAANVQESLTFCVYTLANCGAGGNSVNIGQNPGTDNVLNASTMYGGVSKMDASTNAGTGYVITYATTSPGGASGTQCVGGFSSTTDCITDAGSSAVGPPAPGTGMFGINLKTNTVTLTPSGAIGLNPSGGVGAAVAPYATADQIAFQAGSTPRTVANTGSAPSVTTTYTVTYAAQAANTTKPGAFSATFTWVATGTF